MTDYRLAENSAGGMFTARADLAASMLAQLADDRFIRRTAQPPSDRWRRPPPHDCPEATCLERS